MTWQDYVDQETQAAREAMRLRQAAAQAAAYSAAASRPEPIHIKINIAAAGTHCLVPSMAGRRIAIYELVVWNVAQQDLEFYDGTDSLTGPWNSFAAQTGILLHNVGEPHFKCRSGNDFRLSTSTADQVSGFILYRLEGS